MTWARLITTWLLVGWLCQAGAANITAPVLAPGEAAALDSLFWSLEGPRWANNAGWSSLLESAPSDPCGAHWFGVNCTLDVPSATYHVIGLELEANRLVGSVPIALSDLPFLQGLDLSNNNISGLLDSTVCTLRYLRRLNFGRNSLMGAIPNCIGGMETLLHLELQGNRLSGTLSKNLCLLSGLEALRLHINDIHGAIPSCFGSSMHNLRELALNKNHLTSSIPAALCSLSKLENLYLFQNSLTGSLPACLGGFVSLQYLWAQGNQLHGSLPDGLCQLKNLVSLEVYHNYLSGVLPSCLGNMVSLKKLHVGVNSIGGALPAGLCAMPNLQYILGYSNMFSGQLLPCIGEILTLADLELDNNELTGSLPETLCALSRLGHINLNNNHFSSSIPACYTTDLVSLSSIMLQNNNLEGKIPHHWHLPKLQTVVLSLNHRLHGELRESFFGGCPIIRNVVIEGTKLKGSLPESVCSSRHLATLSLSGNQLSGSIPACITRLPHLHTLRLPSNFIGGVVPESIGNMTTLAVLDLSDNNIRGTVPSSFGELSSCLTTAALELNYLSCNLPQSVRDWANPPPAGVDLRVLSGNYFGCSGGTLAISGASGMKAAGELDVKTYSCGFGAYVLPMGVLAFIVFVPVVFSLIAGVACGWGHTLLRHNVLTSFKTGSEYDLAICELRRFAVGIAGLLLPGAVVLALILIAKSPLQCQYASRPTLSNKDMLGGVISGAFGGALGCAISLGFSLWWWPLPHAGTAATSRPHVSLWAVLTTKNPYHKSSWPSRAVTLMVLGVALVIMTIGPNVVYVLVILSDDIGQTSKVFAELGITLAKALLPTLVVPRAARVAVNILAPGATYSSVRFRLRLFTSAVLTGVTTIAVPVAVVLVTDTRCLFYHFKPPESQTTEIATDYCAEFAADGETCVWVQHGTSSSSFTPKVVFSGNACAAGILDIYTPVFLASILVAAVAPCALEVLVVPVVAGPLHARAQAGSAACRRLLDALRSATYTVSAALVLAGHAEGVDPKVLSRVPSRVVERAFTQMQAVLVVALTFGLAAPAATGLACGLAAGLLLFHLAFVLKQATDATSSFQRFPMRLMMGTDLKGCHAVPVESGAAILLLVLSYWAGASLCMMFNPAAVWGAVLVAAAGVLFGVLAVAQARKRRRKPPLMSRLNDGASSYERESVSSVLKDTGSPGLLSAAGFGMEPLLVQDEDWTESMRSEMSQRNP